MKYSYQRIGRHLDFLDRLPPFPVLFVSLLLLRHMSPTISTATTLWIFVSSLNSTLLSLFRYAFVASKNMQEHVLLHRSQQVRSGLSQGASRMAVQGEPRACAPSMSRRGFGAYWRRRTLRVKGISREMGIIGGSSSSWSRRFGPMASSPVRCFGA